MVDPLKRARDADRDAAIEVVEAAYADGQITKPDYDLRVDRLLRAPTVGEVQHLVSDLRRDPAEPVTDVVEAVTGDSMPSPSAPAPRRATPGRAPGAAPALPRRFGLLLSLVVGLLVLGSALAVAVPVWLSSRDRSGVATGPAGLGDRVDLHTAEGYALLADAVDERTGARVAFRAVLYPDYAVVDVPVDATSQRSFSWYYDGDWSEFGGKGTSTDRRFRLDQVDGDVVARGVELARANVDEPTRWYVIVAAPDGDSGNACVTAYASNDFQESFFVRLTCDGTVVE